MSGTMRKLGLYLGLVEDDEDARDRRYDDDAYDEDGADTDELAVARSGAPPPSGAAAAPADALLDEVAPSSRGADDPDAIVDEERYLPQPPRKRRFLRPLVAVLVLALVVGAGLASAYAWTRTQFYVGADHDQVAIFQGLNQSLPGVSLSRLYEVQPLAVSALPPYYQERVRASIDVPDLNGARLTITELADAARRCSQVPPSAGPSPGARPSATSSPSLRPSAITTPLISWPRTAGRGKATSPRITWRSVWQTPQALTLTNASPARGCGVRMLSTSSLGSVP